MDREKYTSNAEKYMTYRTEYPKEFFDYLYDGIGVSKTSIIADVGAGTGKLSKPLLKRGSFVYGVEPNDDMRRVAKNDLTEFDNFASVKGTADDTTLKDSSIEFVTVGTAFHWFSPDTFRNECRRILKPNGKVILVWISRPVNRSDKFEINFDGISGGKEEKPELIAPFFRDNKFEYKIFKEVTEYNKETFIGRTLSTFDKLTDSKYIDELSDLFDKYSTNGVLTIPLYTRCYVGEVY